uniref:Zinc finger translocation associated n=1 Tax=Xiphophorus couchianus TaxID=32473 RepID=A0A3B5KX92_9TELE
MDFDPQRHGMICMVCGSTLATLKLSTIKRHIRQKHPDSLLWSAADKEVIRSGWESHLSLGAGQRNSRSSSTAGAPTSLQPQEEEDGLPGPSARTLERYLNDSLHAWFRQEFLMEYEAEAGRLLCMVCGAVLPSLHLDHIKSHVLETHPNSLVYSSEEKHCILQAWAQTHGEPDSVKSEPTPNTKAKGTDIFTEDLTAVPINADMFPEGDSTLTQDIHLIGEDGGVGAPRLPSQPLRQSRKRRLRGGDPWRLRLDYLVAYGPQDQGTFCMVCSQVLHESKVSSFRRHIQECHPETTTLSRQEREAMAAIQGLWRCSPGPSPRPLPREGPEEELPGALANGIPDGL